MSHYELVINGRTYAVDLEEVSGSHARVSVNGVAYDVELPGGVMAASSAASAVPAARPAPAARPSSPAPPRPAVVVAPAPVAGGSASGSEVTAPMPGVVLRVPVNAGDSVNAGDTVAVIEAMKMENPILAHVAGTVQEVRVSARQEVAVNQVLLVIG